VPQPICVSPASLLSKRGLATAVETYVSSLSAHCPIMIARVQPWPWGGSSDGREGCTVLRRAVEVVRGRITILSIRRCNVSQRLQRCSSPSSSRL
jgi:hypothetical protein